MQEVNTVSHWLSEHVFACVVDDHVVLLDLRNDQYVGLSGEDAWALCSLVENLPIPPAEKCSDDRATDVRVVLHDMKAAGLITTSRSARHRDPAPAVSCAQASLFQANQVVPRIGLRQVFYFVLAVVRASLSLRFLPLETIVNKTRRRRPARGVSSARRTSQTAMERVAAFETMRPYLFTARNACLFDSLALLNFLSYSRIFPFWVFGVRSAPFGAHCWIQQGDVVFNDTTEHVSRYTPIMTA